MDKVELQEQYVNGLRAKLSERRKQLGLSQEEIAHRMLTTQSAISELESGTTDPRLSTFIRWANAVEYNVSITLHGYMSDLS